MREKESTSGSALLDEKSIGEINYCRPVCEGQHTHTRACISTNSKQILVLSILASNDTMFYCLYIYFLFCDNFELSQIEEKGTTSI
jgi:hypothetical protein